MPLPLPHNSPDKAARDPGQKQQETASRGGACPAMTIQYCAYDDAATRRMVAAYDAVRHRLHGTDYSQDVLEAIAERVIEFTGGSSKASP